MAAPSAALTTERHLFHLEHLDHQCGLHTLVYALRSTQWRQGDKLWRDVERVAARYCTRAKTQLRRGRGGSGGEVVPGRIIREQTHRSFGEFLNCVDYWRVEARKWEVDAARYRHEEGSGVDGAGDTEMVEGG